MKLLPITTIIISNLSLFHAQNPNDCSCVSVDSRVSDQWCIDDCLCDWCDGCNVGVCAGFCDWNCDAPLLGRENVVRFHFILINQKLVDDKKCRLSTKIPSIVFAQATKNIYIICVSTLLFFSLIINRLKSTVCCVGRMFCYLSLHVF